MKSFPSFSTCILLGILTIGVILSAGCSTSQTAATSGKPVFDTAATTVPAAQPPAPAQNTPFIECRAGFTNCNGFCHDLTGDIANCGSCGIVCNSNSACKGGQCACKDGYSSCNGACKDMSSDPQNCGTCGTVCPSTMTCQTGVCMASPGTGTTGQQSQQSTPQAPQLQSDLSCPTFQNNCGGTCVNLLEDNNNCGICNNPCKIGEKCSSGRCIGTSPGCTESGETTCNGICVDTYSDDKNCGGCYVTCRCPALSDPSVYCIPSCTFGKCYVGCTKVVRAGTGSSFAKTYDSLMTDPDNCGTCFNPCPSGQACLNGQCQSGSSAPTTCGSGKTDCSGSCVDTQTDANNCGTCGTKCSAFQFCQNGVCKATGGGIVRKTPTPTPICASGTTLCSGTCVNTQADANNCGSCGVSCAGSTCQNGKCTPAWQGHWTIQTSGPSQMDLVQTVNSVTGSYAVSGRLSGTSSGSPPVLRGTWIWAGGDNGPFEFTMSPDGKSFTGWYTYSLQKQRFTWNGQR